MDHRFRSFWRLVSTALVLASGLGVAGVRAGVFPASRAGVQAAAEVAVAPVQVESDRWYEIWMGGGRAGWSHEFVTTDAAHITTTTVMQMKIGRADEAVEIRMRSEFVETLAGEPVEVRTEQRLGPTPIRATSSSTKLRATPQSAVIALHAASARAMMLRRLARSARRPSGTAAIV